MRFIFHRCWAVLAKTLLFKSVIVATCFYCEGMSTLEISETQFMTDIKKYYTNKLTNCLKNIELNKTGKLYFYSTILGEMSVSHSILQSLLLYLNINE
jgi:hypothetical protein